MSLAIVLSILLTWWANKKIRKFLDERAKKQRSNYGNKYIDNQTFKSMGDG